MTPEALDSLKKKLALENFKRENPHLANEEYFHTSEKSMTIRSYEKGFDSALEMGKLLGRIEAGPKALSSLTGGGKEGDG